METYATPKKIFIICYALGIGLLGAGWLTTGDLMGFFLMLLLLCTFTLRLRISKTAYSTALDVLIYAFLSPTFLAVPIFSAMYHGMYLAAIAIIAAFVMGGPYFGTFALLSALLGLTLRLWEQEYTKRHITRDAEARRYYEMEALQASLVTATAKIEHMTAISERARISREIHDNAGHEIVAALISLQTIKNLLEDTAPDIIQLYDTALARLEAGMHKIRDSVHNLSSVTALGVEALQNICEKYPATIQFRTYGDTRHVPMHIWNVLESCLNEGLTNISKHAIPTYIHVNLDTTQHLIRLDIENDGGANTSKGIGTGLRNLRHRLIASGGNLAITHGKVFHLISTIPLKPVDDECG